MHLNASGCSSTNKQNMFLIYAHTKKADNNKKKHVKNI